MNDRERFLGTMKHQAVDRAPLYEFMWPTWPETAERWAREGGYIPGKTDFGCDKWLVEFSWFWPQPPFALEVLAEDDEHVTFVDPQGIVMREFKNNPLSSMPQFIRYPVETREDFRKYWRERMQPDLYGWDVKGFFCRYNLSRPQAREAGVIIWPTAPAVGKSGGGVNS